MKILIAVDDSVHSDRAVKFVTRMRWPAGSRMIVCSALQPVVGVAATPYEPGAASPDTMAEQRQQTETLVARAQSRLRDAGFSTEGRVLEGDARGALMQVVQDERADLLVVGSHGRTGLEKLMLGSVSSHLVTHARCSVLVVKRAADY